jgi:hypothetical protein
MGIIKDPRDILNGMDHEKKEEILKHNEVMEAKQNEMMMQMV